MEKERRRENEDKRYAWKRGTRGGRENVKMEWKIKLKDDEKERTKEDEEKDREGEGGGVREG